MSHLRRTASAAICFLTLFRFVCRCSFFFLYGVWFVIAHHFPSPTDTLACCVGFPCQLPTQTTLIRMRTAPWWFMRPKQQKNKRHKNSFIHISLINEGAKQMLCKDRQNHDGHSVQFVVVCAPTVDIDKPFGLILLLSMFCEFHLFQSWVVAGKEKTKGHMYLLSSSWSEFLKCFFAKHSQTVTWMSTKVSKCKSTQWSFLNFSEYYPFLATEDFQSWFQYSVFTINNRKQKSKNIRTWVHLGNFEIKQPNLNLSFLWTCIQPF